MQRFDLHLHSNHSPDCRTKVPEILAVAKKRGFGISVTDHNEIAGCLEALRQEDVPVIPGIEVTSRDGIDFLCYFPPGKALESFFGSIREHRRRDFLRSSTLSGDAILLEARRHHGLIALAHPYRYLIRVYDAWKTMPLIRRYARIVDAIEATNGKTFQFLNHRAERLARELGKPAIAGSDAHALGDLQGAYTIFPDGLPPLEAVRSGKATLCGKGDRVLVKLCRSAKHRLFRR